MKRLRNLLRQACSFDVDVLSPTKHAEEVFLPSGVRSSNLFCRYIRFYDAVSFAAVANLYSDGVHFCRDSLVYVSAADIVSGAAGSRK